MASNVLRTNFRLLSSSQRSLGLCSARALPRLAGAPSGSVFQAFFHQRASATYPQLRTPTLPGTMSSNRGMGLIIRAAATEASGPAKVLFEPASLPSFTVDTSTIAGAWEGDLLVVTVSEDDLKTEGDVTTIISDSLKEVDVASGGTVMDIVTAGGFEGKQGQQSKVMRVGSAPGLKARQLALVGIGKGGQTTVTSDWGVSPSQALGNAVAGLAKAARAARVGILSLHKPATEADVPAAVSQIATGVLLGGWEGTRFKSKTPPTATKLAEVHLLPRIPFNQVPGDAMKAMAANLKPAVDKAVAVAQGTLLTRYLVEAPPNVCTPEHIADAAAHIASLAPSTCTLRVLERADCEAMNMGLYLGVAVGSDLPPKFVHLTYTSPGDGPKKKIAIVGKGVTFDSGGYNIKAGPGSMIEMMKFDMGGSAATLGAARILASLSPPGLEAHFIVPACENMVSGKAVRPGDVLTSASGKTVEINNTDAEGRLTLADALWYAQEKCGATSVIDTATLTGAIIVALGTDIAGFYTPSEAMANSMTTAAKAAGEKLWRMPLETSYFEGFKSSCADMKNSSGRWGGSIAAAMFLKQFVNEGVEWAHIDMAGPVWDEKAGLPTGYGAATLAQWAIAQAES